MENKLEWIRYIAVWTIILLIPAIMGYTAHDYIEPYITSTTKEKPAFKGMTYSKENSKVSRNITDFLNNKNKKRRI